MNDPVFRNVRFLPGIIHAGFPSPASEYEERNIDIHDLVVPHPTSSYFMRVSGDSMTGACMYSDDSIVIDRIGEEFTLKRLQITQHRKIFLKPENPKYTAIEVTSRDDFEV
jgi:DNA polymerase V